MTTMSLSSQYNDLQDFLQKHSTKADKNTNSNESKEITHTRIGNKDLNVYGGSFHIPTDKLPTFYRLYYDYIFVKGKKEYLTEKQLKDNGPCLVDLDFRYSYDVESRQHTSEHIRDIIQIYLEEFRNMFEMNDTTTFPIFVMEKPNVNRVAKDEVTKDGIHFIFGIQMDITMKIMLRENVLKQFEDVVDLPITNSFDKVIDDGIANGTVNWQLYGSQKPGNEAYRLTHYLTANYNANDDELVTTTKSLKEFDLMNNFHLLSAQYDKHIKLELKSQFKEEYEKRLSKPKTKVKKPSKINLTIESDSVEETNAVIRLEDITNAEILQKAVDAMLATFGNKELSKKEIHYYTQILPEKYYEPGSHLMNRKVAFALKNTDERLFLSWVMLRSKASDFDYASIPSLYYEWSHHFNKNDENKSQRQELTKASIIYWAKQDAREEYEKIKSQTLDQLIEDSIFESGEWDYAMVLYQMFKDQYVCSSLKNKTWYRFKGHRWEQDEGQRLRLAISQDLHMAYARKIDQYLAQMHDYSQNDTTHEKLQRKINKITELQIKFKKTNDKNNIMREAAEIFYDNDFVNNMDNNPYLLGFENGVVDLRTGEFRDGRCQDYITKSTKQNYIPYNLFTEKEKQIEVEIHDFMKKIFPLPRVCSYMWDHLASCTLGVKKQHTFNIYRGSGSNGKSMLTDLMTHAMGDYKGTMPITLVTDKRTTLGSATPEIMALKGVRYAVMQEPSTKVTINEGVMKELTGGDQILGRALYCSSEVFNPQFSLAVCTNALFEVKARDDGTWRRMKLVDFISKFVGEGDVYNDKTPYVFPKDVDLKEKLPSWASVFISLLVKRVCETGGIVIDCPEVTEANTNYRLSQNALMLFINDKIESQQNEDGISFSIISSQFKAWYTQNYDIKTMPKAQDLREVIIEKFGNPKTKNKWFNFIIKHDEDNVEEIMNG